MVGKLIEWALHNPLVVILIAAALTSVGAYSFLNVNVEAYPDPAPAIVEVIALFPGASAEEVERQATIPLEVTFRGMPGLKSIRSQSLFGLSDLKMNWNYGYTYEAARQEVINRLATITQPLPPGVTPAISPESPTGEIYRYILKVPKDAFGREIYTLNDIKALQDWVLEREFRTVPRIVDVTSFGGTVRRYEVQPDPDRLRRYGITLAQLQTALTNSNATVGGDYVNQGQVAFTVRSVGLFGGGKDPVDKVLGLNNPFAATSILRAEELRRVRDIRSLVIASVNNQPIRVDDVVEGGRVSPGQQPGDQGVVVNHQTRLGRIGYWKPDRERHPGSSLTLVDVGHDEDDKVQCIVLLRKGEDTLPALKVVKAKVQELNDPTSGRMLPGVEIEPYYDREDLVRVTTETVTENLATGVLLVVIVLFVFLSNVRTAIIVAVNIPLALLFAFSMLFLRGKSANLLSIGAVDFGIIVDSAVIMVENVYRHLASGEHAGLALKERILRSAGEIDRALLFSTLIMVCAFVPLFAMTGPEGQLFGPMAQTYAFSLAGALLLAVTLTPVLCLVFLRNLKPSRENLFVRWLKASYLRQLERCLNHRVITLTVFIVLTAGTVLLLPAWPGKVMFAQLGLAEDYKGLGTEFMPELEEGNLWIRCTAPLNQTLERNVEIAKQARNIMAFYPEVESIVSQSGRPDDGTDAAGFFNTEYFVPLRQQKDWPALKSRGNRLADYEATGGTFFLRRGWCRLLDSAELRLCGTKRPRSKEELVADLNAELERRIPGVIWNFSQNIRDNVMESLSGIKGDNSVKIFGPDIDQLERLAIKAQNKLQQVQGIENVGIFHIRGQSHLEFRVDPEKCQRWGISTADVNNVVSSALGGAPQSNMVEGEKLFNIAIRWPKRLRDNETSILDIPVDVINNQVVLAQGSSFVPNAMGHALPPPSPAGTLANTANPISQQAPRLRLRDLVSPVGEDGAPDPSGRFERAGASDIYRENGKRMIAIKFSVRDRDLGSAVSEAREKTAEIPELKAPYRAVWSGEFEQMEEAQGRLLWIVPIALGLIFALLYSAFRSFLDSAVVLTNVLALSLGGIWALLLTGINFSISAAVGFVSIFGVAIMDGLLLVSYFNQMRALGLPVRIAILQGAERRVRPVMMTALTAILGLLPAALSTRIGAQTARPLAIVVVGGMITTLFLTRYLMPVLYSFYGHREPPAGTGQLTH
jgi:cobalt-zinc-cadmium resistance protein CzcA